MRILNAVSHPISAIVALAMLGACSGGSSPMAPGSAEQNTEATSLSVEGQGLPHRRVANGVWPPNRTRLPVTTPSFMDPAVVSKPLVFVGEYSLNSVDIYLQTGKNKMVGQITGLSEPDGLTADTAGNVYVANFSGSNVQVYAPPYTGAPALTLNDTGNGPVGLAVSAQGIVAVANCTAPSCLNGSYSVAFYAKNSTTPCATVVADPTKFSYLSYPAFDHKGKLYVTGGYDSGSKYVTVVGEVKGGCNAKTIGLLKTNNTIRLATGIQVGKDNRIAIEDSCSGSCSSYIYTYDAPVKGSLGTPVSTTTLKNPRTVVGFAFVASGKNLYTAEWNTSSSDIAGEYDYPAGGAPEDVITVDPGGAGAFGPAVTPPLIP
jgi:hypothetical protein